MPVSYAENLPLSCPACHTPFTASVWTLIDTAERPDLAQALAAGELNQITCPQCGWRDDAGAPLLVHDPAGRRVYFAAPDGAPEHVWRERAQELLYLLVGSLPEEARQPYLGDVQVEIEVAGVRRALARRGRRFPAPPAPPAPAPPTPAPVDPAPLLEVLPELLAADTPAELRDLVARHPALLDPAADALLAQLAETAYAEGQHPVGQALDAARRLLHNLGAGADDDRLAQPPGHDDPHGAQPSAAPASPPDAGWQLLLRATSPDDLLDAVRGYPMLLEPQADDELALLVEAAIDDGNERQAALIERRREALAELRAELTSPPALMAAIDQLVRAGSDPDALEAVIGEFPALLTSAAQDALFELAAGARGRGDEQLAEYAVECRAMLRQIRDGLSAG